MPRTTWRFATPGGFMPNHRVPNELKRKRGTLRADRMPTPISSVMALEPVAERTLDTPPTHLGEAGRSMWTRVANHCRAWIAESDLDALRLLAEAADRRSELVARLANDGWVLYTDKGYAYAHPAAGMLNTTEGEIRKWMALLGLTPADRSRLGVAEVKARTALEELAARRTAHLDKVRGA